MCKDKSRIIWTPPPIVTEPFAEVYDDPVIVVEDTEHEGCDIRPIQSPPQR